MKCCQILLFSLHIPPCASTLLTSSSWGEGVWSTLTGEGEGARSTWIGERVWSIGEGEGEGDSLISEEIG